MVYAIVKAGGLGRRAVSVGDVVVAHRWRSEIARYAPSRRCCVGWRRHTVDAAKLGKVSAWALKSLTAGWSQDFHH